MYAMIEMQSDSCLRYHSPKGFELEMHRGKGRSLLTTNPRSRATGHSEQVCISFVSDLLLNLKKLFQNGGKII